MSASSRTDVPCTAPGGLTGWVVALARPELREAAATALGALLGGQRLLVFVHDEEVDALLPAPGFPQTLPDGRAWRRFLAECVALGEGAHAALPPPGGGPPCPARGIASGTEAVAVVLGTARRAPELGALRELLPLLAAALRGERMTSNAETQARLARQSASRAEALARALDLARMQLQRTLIEAEEARRSAEKASLAKSDFLATMSHELRTPLNAIGGHVQLIQLGIHGPVTDAQRAALARVERSQRHLLGLINEVLNLARIEAGSVEYRITDVRVADVLADVQAMIEPQVAAKRLRFAAHPASTELVARADAEKLQQILLNLLSNAVKFTPPDGTIGVECVTDPARPRFLLLRVTDTGIGVPADRLADIFEPFVQVDASRSREGGGVGLGLAISRDLARGMGGDLTVESTVGRGSRFTISLPRG